MPGRLGRALRAGHSQNVLPQARPAGNDHLRRGLAGHFRPASVPAGPAGPAGQQSGPPSYGFAVAVPPGDVAAVTAVIRQAYDSRGALDISVAGKTWAAPQVFKPFPGQQFQIFLPSRSQILRLRRILVPPS